MTTTTAPRVVVCGSISQAPLLAGVAAALRATGSEVLHPQPSARPEADLIDEWMSAIEAADLVVVVPKPDGSLGAQTTRELRHAITHRRSVTFWEAS